MATATAIKTDAIAWFRPSSTVSNALQTNLVAWTEAYFLKPLYRLRRWIWAQQTPTVTTTSGTSTYTPALTGGATEILYIVAATLNNQDLFVPPISQASAFWTGTGTPDAVSLLPANPVTQLQLFPTPNGTFTVPVALTTPLTPLLDDGMMHNYLTDDHPALVFSAMLTCGFMFLQEDNLAKYWTSIFVQRVREVARYDHEVRHGGTMPEPFEPYLPTLMPMMAGSAAAG